jgi:hypothetical protein
VTSLLVKKTTMTDQVVAHLERAIMTRELKPLSRLQSTRDLACTFGVSQKVVITALDRLEEKRLVRRVARSGVFVSEQATDPKVTDALIFAFGDNPERNPFINRICGVVSSDAARGKIDFFSRHVTLSYERLRDRDYMLRRLDGEVARLSKQFRPDVALVMGPAFDHDDVAKCLELPFPLLFVGDFKDGDFPDLSYNRLGFSFDFYDEPVRWAAKRGAKRVTLMHGIGVEQSQYLTAALASMQRMGEKAGVEVKLIQVSDSHSDDAEKQKAGLAAAAKQYAISDDADVIVLDCLYHHNFLMDRLREHGAAPLTEHLQVVSCQQIDEVPGLKFLRETPASVALLHERLCELMQELARGDIHGHREEFTVSREIIE